MRAAVITEYGGANVMQIVEDAVKPEAGEGQVLVQVHAAAVNPFDIKVREGVVRQMAELNFPAVLGGDVAGVIAEVGDAVTNFEVGQEVYGVAGALSSHGSFAEFTPVLASQLAAKPKTVDMTAAAAIPLVGSSAYQALVDTMQLQAGQKILIHGGAGGIGSFAIQLAKQIGAYVATTASAETTDFVATLGADEVIDYATTDFSEKLLDYDAVYDTVGGDTYKKSFIVLKKGGALVSMVEPVDEALAAEYSITVTSQFTRTTTARLEKIANLIDAGAIKIYVDKTFEFDQTAEAMEYVKLGHPKGKVVINMRG
ncbi:MAG: NADP-dependent oxidoreductase [Patescibacteria group bacterium]|nr:NADP-dependent oxidoreductase [Patescibacteria group bacterium]